MMIEDYSVFREIPFTDLFSVEPYYSTFHNHGRRTYQGFPATSDTSNGRRGRQREFTIPIQVEGIDFPSVSQHIDLTDDVDDVNVNNSGLHSRSRNRRRHHVITPHNSGGGKSDNKVLSLPVSKTSSGTGISHMASTQSGTDLSDDIIDLCMYEDMCDSDVGISESYKEKSVSTSQTMCNHTSMASETKQEVPSKVIAPTPSYPVYKYLKTQLARDGRLIDYIRGDGNCFFRALSKEIYGSEEFHEDVRQAVVDLIEKYSKEFEQFLDSGTCITDHIKEMRKASTWASSAEIYAAATLVQRDIYVLSPDHTGEAYHWMLFKPRFIYTRDTSYHPCFITLCHTHGNHYDRITPQQGACNCDYDPPVLSGVHAYVDLTN